MMFLGTHTINAVRGGEAGGGEGEGGQQERGYDVRYRQSEDEPAGPALSTLEPS